MSKGEQRDPKIDRELRKLNNMIPGEIIQNYAAKAINDVAAYERIAFHQSLKEAGLIDLWSKEFADRRTNSATPEGNHAQAS